jgi:hypothetical protein
MATDQLFKMASSEILRELSEKYPMCPMNRIAILESQSPDFNIVMRDITQSLSDLKNSNRIHQPMAVVILAKHQSMILHIKKLLDGWDSYGEIFVTYIE